MAPRFMPNQSLHKARTELPAAKKKVDQALGDLVSSGSWAALLMGSVVEPQNLPSPFLEASLTKGGYSVTRLKTWLINIWVLSVTDR